MRSGPLVLAGFLASLSAHAEPKRSVAVMAATGGACMDAKLLGSLE